ncbi:N-acetylglucosamine 6-phosphate deacetylase [Chitinophaga sp. CF118]|uniref:N-acetylglucosamine-6-phosphate deacetylase n=1 Tax=Chitinophaga sp. CF118 TaxID=1884367 RepID=UPI0008E22202|nr:N-acetylglucosamine-6-phosphate deacetylase [Chitinophaga sp. CF118]SFE24547.1 N-acetylglucosamine 6-phosphate deacetylase [Chitinophaga sp. CF118]
MLKAWTNATIFTGKTILHAHAVLTENGLITSVVPVAEVPAHAVITDLKGATLAPALIDLQIYGGNGGLFPLHPNVATLEAIYAYCKAGGAAFFMPTIPTMSFDVMLQSIEAVKQYWAQGGEGVLGLHLEGPFMNPEKKGAHLTQYIKSPTKEDIDWLLEHGRGIIKMMTLAPECCDPELVKMLQDAGILISAGHSNGTYEQSYQAFENGITTCTHLFNAMSQLQSRAPGFVGAIYDHPEINSSIVVDGIHVDFNAVRISKKIMGSRLFLITDAVAEGKTGDYIYVEEEDRYVNAQGILAGSRLTMLQAVRNCITKVGIDPEEALRMGATYPARVAGLGKELGYIEPGYRASMIVLDEQWQLKQLINE